MSLLNSNELLNRVFLVVGSDTGVGKTVFSGLFAKYIVNKGLGVSLFKPFCSGGREDIEFLERANAEINQANVNDWYFEKPISPAAWELRYREKIDFNNIIEKLKQRSLRKDTDIIMIEGVGGLLAPINSGHTVASIGQIIGAQLVIVAANKVGVINHVLLSIEAALSRGLSIAAVILMEQEEQDSSAADNAELIRMHSPEMANFKGVYEFPWLGKEADNPEIIPFNVKKAEKILEIIFDEVFSPCFFNDSNH